AQSLTTGFIFKCQDVDLCTFFKRCIERNQFPIHFRHNSCLGQFSADGFGQLPCCRTIEGTDASIFEFYVHIPLSSSTKIKKPSHKGTALTAVPPLLQITLPLSLPFNAGASAVASWSFPFAHPQWAF